MILSCPICKKQIDEESVITENGDMLGDDIHDCPITGGRNYRHFECPYCGYWECPDCKALEQSIDEEFPPSRCPECGQLGCSDCDELDTDEDIPASLILY